jgi:nucleoside-diphosphate-sugar epimerase
MRDIEPTHLLHLAWFSGHGQIWSTTENLDWVAASMRIATSFARSGGKRLVMAGSCAEYSGSGRFDEAMTANPGSLYGIAKRSTRETVDLMAQQEGVSFAWPRLFHMYGPFEDERRLVASAIRTLLDGKIFPCSDGMQVRDFLFIEDVASALISLLFSDIEGAVNLGSGLPITLRRLLETVGDEIGRKELLRFGEKARTAHDPDVLIPSVDRQCIELGWYPKHNLSTGVKRSVEWWQSNRTDVSLRF